MCCASGKVKLPELHSPPEPLSTFLSGVTRVSKHFLENIRKYNSCFKMTSFGATNIVRENYMPTFRVQGQIYHHAGSLLPLPDADNKFLQIYFMANSDEQIEQRCHYNAGTRREIVGALQGLFDQHNELVRLFKTAIQRMPADDYAVVIRADKRPVGQHERQFNAPTIDEVAIVIVGEEFESRDIILHRRSGDIQRVSETHRSYDGVQYPILFWRGDDGYHFNIKMINPQTGEGTNKKVSAMNYYLYRLMIRQNAENHILKCRQLFHQYIVDMYAKIETEQILYIRLNQTELRSEQYIHLRDAIVNDGNVNPNELGRMAILPSTFTGSPRHMHEYAQDAMTYVHAYGRPDLFVTFTCNPTWNEIKELLLVGQSSSDRHDITARVFKQKLKCFMDFIIKHHVFGETRCWMYSIEWQKRGLPHAHILVCEECLTTQRETVEVARIALRLPPFWKSNVRLWIAQCDHAFTFSGISSDDTKYSALVANLDAETLSYVSDIVLSPPNSDKYHTLSQRLITQFSDSDTQKIKKLLTDLQLGDEKPSHLLRKMKELSNGQLQDDFLQSLWLQRMPPHIQTVLSASSEPLDKLAIIADKVSEVVGASSTICAATTVPPPSQSSSCSAQPTMDSLARQIQELSLQVAELIRERNSSRHQRYSSDRRRSHSRSRSVNRGSGICYYHRRYKEQARKCVSPWAFVQKNE
ncbi:helitron_like_N domain-containing protein [Trichonephila clavipes]|nr:helitron_like_N domain-containing protein [Trichonephila clavipes]